MNQSFGQRWGWFAWLYTLAGNDVRLREAWLRTTIVEFFNQLAFIIELNAENDRLRRR